MWNFLESFGVREEMVLFTFKRLCWLLCEIMDYKEARVEAGRPFRDDDKSPGER